MNFFLYVRKRVSIQNLLYVNIFRIYLQTLRIFLVYFFLKNSLNLFKISLKLNFFLRFLLNFSQVFLNSQISIQLLLINLQVTLIFLSNLSFIPHIY